MKNLGRLGSFFKNLVGLNGNGFIDEFTKLAFTNNLYLIIAALLCSFPIAKLIEKAARKSAVRGICSQRFKDRGQFIAYTG